MKKLIALALALMLLLGILAVPAMAEETQKKTCGVLSFLNITEADETDFVSIRQPMLKLLALYGVLVPKSGMMLNDTPVEIRFYDSRNALLLALGSGEVKVIKVPYYTARYFCSTNDRMMITADYYPEKATGIAAWALGLLSDGYSFMLKEENTALRDEFDAQITAMKEDGTLQELIDEYIVKASEGVEPVAVAFEKFEGDPIKIGVSGDLPPMDYIAADGSFAGFNTAVLAEIGKRLQKNIELVQVENVGRSLALSEGRVDVVFWTRALSGSYADLRREQGTLNAEEWKSRMDKILERMPDEERAILEEGQILDAETKAKIDSRDMPPSTIITLPYYTDFSVLVKLKEAQ